MCYSSFIVLTTMKFSRWQWCEKSQSNVPIKCTKFQELSQSKNYPKTQDYLRDYPRLFQLHRGKYRRRSGKCSPHLNVRFCGCVVDHAVEFKRCYCEFQCSSGHRLPRKNSDDSRTWNTACVSNIVPGICQQKFGECLLHQSALVRGRGRARLGWRLIVL